MGERGKTGQKLFAVLLLAAACSTLAQARSAAETALLERGRVLVEGVMACGNCHQARDAHGQPLPARGLSGGQVIDEPPFRAVAPNITPDPATGIGRWTDEQLAKAIREGLRPDGSLIGPPMPFGFYRHIADDDLKAVIAYLRAQPAVEHAVEKSTYRMPLPPAYGPPVANVPVPPRSDRVRYGEYLARIGHCMDCHTPRGPDGQLVMDRLGAGGQAFNGPWGQSLSRNLTPHDSGLKRWSDAEIARAIREGLSRDGHALKPPMGYAFYRHIPRRDMVALIAYLRSLKPLPAGG